VTVDPDVHYTTRVDGKFLLLDGDFVPGKPYTLTIAKASRARTAERRPENTKLYSRRTI